MARMMANGEEKDEDKKAFFGATSDRRSLDDKIGFEQYVLAVKEFLSHPDTDPPLTLSIEGPWGSGKSSFMGQLKESLDEDGHKTVEFNPWKHEQQESLWASFALTFISDLEDEASWYNRPWKRTYLAYQRLVAQGGYAAVIKVIGTFLLYTVPVVLLLSLSYLFGVEWLLENIQNSSLSPVVESLQNNSTLFLGTGSLFVSLLAFLNISKRVRAQFNTSVQKTLKEYASNPNYKEKTEFIDSFQDDFKNILDTYVDEEERVYVFIDDLDRCTTPKAADLMQSLSLMLADDPRLVFVMGLDRQRVAAGVAAKHNDLFNHFDSSSKISENTIDFGYRYIEKFIQVPFLVPEPQEDSIKKLVREEMGTSDEESTPTKNITQTWNEDISEPYENSLEDIIEMATPALGNNPRRIKRFMNLYRLRITLANLEDILYIDSDTPATDKVALPQLAKFVIISIQWPQLISRMYVDPASFEKLAESAENEEFDGTDGIEKWSSDDQLMDLLAYGTDRAESKYSLKESPVSDLIKISPRADKPTESNKPETGSVQRMSVAWFDEGNRDVEEIFQSTHSESNVNVRLEPIQMKDEMASLKNPGRVMHCPIWIAGPSAVDHDWFKHLYDSAPTQTTLLIYDPQSTYTKQKYHAELKDASVINNETDLKSKVGGVIKSTYPTDGSEAARRSWNEWQKEANKVRNNLMFDYNEN